MKILKKHAIQSRNVKLYDIRMWRYIHLECRSCLCPREAIEAFVTTPAAPIVEKPGVFLVTDFEGRVSVTSRLDHSIQLSTER